MNIILLSGGSGKRLWPLSNNVRSKQFIKLFKACDGSYESMLQRIYRQILSVDKQSNILISTSKEQISAIHNQLGEQVSVSAEPYRKDTFPAIALATAYMHEIQGISRQEIVAVCPIDPYVENDYFYSLKNMTQEQMAKYDINITLMGIEPTYPSEDYGYIIPESKDYISNVSLFREKPDVNTAKEYISKGALWNCGVFAYKLDYILQKSKELLGSSDYQELYEAYDTLPKISFDYAVVEKERKIQVMRFSGKWKDLGSWNTLTETMGDPIFGDGMIDKESRNVSIVNELDVPILTMGVDNIVVSASPDGILVTSKERCNDIKTYVEKLNNEPKFAEKSWGYFKVIEGCKNSLTIKIFIREGHAMNYHSHEHRDEVWIVTQGVGKTIIDGIEQKVKMGNVVAMQARCRHTIFAVTDLEMIEVQIGSDISVYDKQKYILDNKF